ncbi:hypothetical protein HanIR_Chr16g0797721 [Helianthus annuus]|nr:hypothetical protein HanIR_Chr16g0797721 [Helianthus annuus]
MRFRARSIQLFVLSHDLFHGPFNCCVNHSPMINSINIEVYVCSFINFRRLNSVATFVYLTRVFHTRNLVPITKIYPLLVIILMT